MTESLYSEIRFVGRQKEIEQFEHLLKQTSRNQWAILLWGEGGVGKTQLLRKFLQIAARAFPPEQGGRVFSEDSILDLYWTENRREESLLKNLALRLDAEGFQEFFSALKAYEEGAGAEEDIVNAETLREAFLAGYKRLPAEHIVLAFDTAERVTESVLRFFRGLLQEMHAEKPGTLVLLAGRPESLDKIRAAFGETCDPWKINYLQEEDIEAYLKVENLTWIQKDALAQILHLTGGKPIRVALVVDWLKEGNDLDDLLRDLKNRPREVDRSLVRRVANVQYPEDWLILYMALLSRRFNLELASLLLSGLSADLSQHLKEMCRFSFVKYYPPSPSQPQGNWQLHDEMRDLLNLYIWPEQDPTGGIRRRALSSIIENYYVPKLKGNPEFSESLDLQQERLYYTLQVDFEQAFKEYEELAREAEKNGERTASYFEVLNNELSPYESRMSERQRRTWRVNQVIAASLISEKSAQKQALDTIAGENWQTWDAASQAELRYRLALIYQRSGNQKRLLDLCSLQMGEDGTQGEWIQWFESVLQENLTSGERLSILLDYARLLSAVGLVYRSQNRLNNAITCFQESIRICELAKQVPGVEQKTVALAIANAQNNLGYAYLRLGRVDEALAECQAALDIRKHFGSARDIGYSYNVIGTIRVEQLRPEEAVTCFQQARNAFESARFETGLGLVLVAHGRLLRQWGEYREISGEPPEKAREKYEAAEPMLNQAVGIFRRTGDQANLMESLNEKGTLLRQLKRWKEAEECYKESLQISKNLGNRYRQSDNECDLGILYFRQGELKRALEHAERAAELTEEIQAYYLKAKTRQTAAEIYLKQKEYEHAFQAAADAAAGILRLSPDRFSESAAKRMLEYERVKKWLREQVILSLPSQELVNQLITLLIERWRNEVVEAETGKTLANEFPGFISAMESARRDYELLKSPEAAQ